MRIQTSETTPWGQGTHPPVARQALASCLLATGGPTSGRPDSLTGLHAQTPAGESSQELAAAIRLLEEGAAIANFFSPVGAEAGAACSNAADGAPVKRDGASGDSLCRKGSTTVIFFAGADVTRVADLLSVLRADARGRAWADLDDTLPECVHFGV